MILITEFMDEDAVNLLKKKYDVYYDISLAEDSNSLVKLINKMKALIVRNKTLVTRELIENAPNLTCVGRLGVGLDNIDLNACEEQNITVYPALGANSHSVAEYVICASMLLLRKAYFKKNEMIAGNWPRQESSGSEVYGKTLGLIGFGDIAQKTRDLALGLGIKTVAYDPYLDKDSNLWKETKNLLLDNLLSISDIISLHIPLSKETKNLIDEKKLRLIKNSSVIINTSRGGIIDENSLAKLLKENKIGGAALDVFNKEPINKVNAKKFEGLDNIILTPHIGGVTKESNERVSKMIAKKIDIHLSK
jgi:(S)-sulfolactate dehydrogenase|tara:strand:- start:812 stop:1732 length:921 start_codon:yes stop_codon:yes gene_type:complete